MKSSFAKICRKILLPLAFWLGVWQIMAEIVGFPLLLPTPVSVGQTLLELAATAAFWRSVALSIGRVCFGMGAGCILGSLAALLTWRCSLLDLLLSPAIRVLRATPVVSFILLVYLWVARANIPGVISALMVCPIIFSSLRTGLEAADRQLLELAKAYRFGRIRTLRLVWIPLLRPHLNNGVSTAFGLAWKAGIAAEVICPPRYAIGTELSKAKTGLLSPSLYAWTIVIVILSLVLDAVLRRILRIHRKGQEQFR